MSRTFDGFVRVTSTISPICLGPKSLYMNCIFADRWMGLIQTDRATQHVQPLRADGKKAGCWWTALKIIHRILMILLLMSNIIFRYALPTHCESWFMQKNSPAWGYWMSTKKYGGATQSRTGLDGFAIRCITALLSRHGQSRLTKNKWMINQRPKI